jgi:hypothetical protein
MLLVWIPPRTRCTTLKFVSDLQQVGGCPSVSSINKTDHHDIFEILLKVALNTIKQTNKHLIIPNCIWMFSIGSLIVTWPLTIIEWPTYFHWTGWQPFYFYRQFCFNRGVVTIDNLSIFTFTDNVHILSLSNSVNKLKTIATLKDKHHVSYPGIWARYKNLFHLN